MAVTPLGILGSVVNDDPGGSSDVLDITLTTGIAASDVTTDRVVAIRFVTVSPTAAAYSQPDTIVDTAPLTEPNVCYGPNDYSESCFTAAGDIFLVEGILTAPIVQPLGIGDTISIFFTEIYDYARAVVFGYDVADFDPNSPCQSWSDYFPLPAPSPTCQSVPATLPADTEYVNLGAVEWLDASVTSITFVDGGATVLDDFYDWAGSAHVSGAWGEAPAAPGAFDIGACTDSFPGAALDFQGSAAVIVTGATTEPCPAAYGIRGTTGDLIVTA